MFIAGPYDGWHREALGLVHCRSFDIQYAAEIGGGRPRVGEREHRVFAAVDVGRSDCRGIGYGSVAVSSCGDFVRHPSSKGQERK